MNQCEHCSKDCIARTMPDPCKVCVHNNKRDRLKTCIDCGLSCKFQAKHKKQPKGRVCQLCQRVGDLQEHHLLRGAYRSTADKYGLTIYICGHCHNELHNDSEKLRLLQIVGQILFEHNRSRDEFRAEFGRSYIMSDEDEQAGLDVLGKMRRREPLF